MRTLFYWFALGCIAAAQTNDAAQDLLVKVENELNKADKQYHLFNVVVRRRYPAAWERRGFTENTVEYFTAGTRRLFQFVSKGDHLEGTKILALSPSQVYVYLPAFYKTRRVANPQNVLGIPIEDFYQNYSLSYVAEFAVTSGRQLVLKPKPEVKTSFTRIEIDLEPDKDLLMSLRYFVGDFLVKVEDRSGYECVEKYYPQGLVCMPSKIVIERLDSIVNIKNLAWDSNVPFPETLFTRQSLETTGPVKPTVTEQECNRLCLSLRNILEESKTSFKRLHKKAESDATGDDYWTAAAIPNSEECTVHFHSHAFSCRTPPLGPASRLKTLKLFEEAIRRATPTTWVTWRSPDSLIRYFGPDKEHGLIVLTDSSPSIFISVEDYAGWY